MKNKFSIAICPPDEFVEAIRRMKEKLAEKIRWFASRRSAAHFTLNVFECDDNELMIWKEYLKEFCKPLHPFEVVLDKSGSNSSGAFFLAPDEISKNRLVEIMRQFHRNAPFEAGDTNSDPHLSIARRLRGKRMNDAKKLFGNESFDLRFTCTGLAIRKFNPEIKQYEIESRFDFGSQKSL